MITRDSILTLRRHQKFKTELMSFKFFKKTADLDRSKLEPYTKFGEQYCWLVRGSLFIELGCPRDLGKRWIGDLGTFMMSRPI